MFLVLRENSVSLRGKPITRLFLSFTLGVVTTIAVAWAAAVGALGGKWQPGPFYDDGALILDTARRPGGRGYQSGYVVHRVGIWPNLAPGSPVADAPGWARTTLFPPERTARIRATSSGDTITTLWGFGWPLPALKCWLVESDMHGVAARPKLGIADDWWNWTAARFSLPISPVPLGFLVNTLVAAACWFALLSIPRAWQTLQRARRGPGVCRECGYSRAGIDARASCPECGSPSRFA